MRDASVLCRRLSQGLSGIALIFFGHSRLMAQVPPVTDPQSGLRMMVASEDSCPTLRVLRPGDAATGGLLIVYPEHVTVLEHGTTEARHLYLWKPGQACKPVAWRKVGSSLEYEMEVGRGHPRVVPDHAGRGWGTLPCRVCEPIRCGLRQNRSDLGSEA